MTIDEAIKILEEQRDLEIFNDFKGIRDGFQLGIEALKLYMALKATGGVPRHFKGIGETEK